MIALLLALAIFCGCGIIGIGLLALTGADLSATHVALTAPAVGSCVVLIPCFLLSYAGVAIDAFGEPLIIALLVAAAAVIAVRRPRLPWIVLPTLLVLIAGLGLMGWPMFSSGFRWLANGNSDMSSYILGAVQLMRHGLLAPLDTHGLNGGTDYATTTVGVNLWGQRPGADLMVAVVARTSGRAAYETYMPVSLGLALVGACSTGSFAFTVARRNSVSLLAIVLAVVSPLATYAVVQGLLPQLWGTAILIAVFSLLLRDDLYAAPRNDLAFFVPIGVLIAGVVLVYVEVLPELVVTYLVYVVVGMMRNRIAFRSLWRTWIPVLLVVAILLNAYGLREANYLLYQVHHGTKSERLPLFGFALVPSSLPGILGLQMIPASPAAPLLNISIIATAVVFAVIAVGAAIATGKGSSIGVTLIVYAALGVVLAINTSYFGLFKLFMYVQPLLAVGLAVGCLKMRRGVLLMPALAALVIAQLFTQHAYVRASTAPIDAPEISSAGTLPVFLKAETSSAGPTISATANPFLMEIEASAAGGKPLFFMGRDLFALDLSLYGSHTTGRRRHEVEHEILVYPWRSRHFELLNGYKDGFKEDVAATRAFTSKQCNLVVSTGRTLVLNRFAFPASDPTLMYLPCKHAQNFLVFTQSALGEAFYLAVYSQDVSFWQLQEDPYFPGTTMAGMGRYALFKVLHPTVGARLELTLSTTLLSGTSRELPPAVVIGDKRTRLPLVGNGSARVYSSALTPQLINNESYLMLDMDANGYKSEASRGGLQGLYGASIPLETRSLTSYVQDVSLVSAKQYNRLKPPTAVERFPEGLANQNLEYSGIYEDGWMGARAYVVLAGGKPCDLLIRGEVPQGAGRNVEVLVNGKTLMAKSVAAGRLALKVAVGYSDRPRKIELRFGATIHLAPPDGRVAAAHLSYIGLMNR